MKQTEYLVIIGAHQNTAEKVESTIELLKSFENIDVAFLTHCTNDIDKISKYCKYLLYDSENCLVNRFDYIDNHHHINSDDIDTQYFMFYQSNIFNIQTSYFASPHGRAALSLIKQGIDIASQNEYQYIVYIEYDLVIPKIGWKKLIENQIQKIKNKNAKSFRVFKESYLWGGFFIADIILFKNDKKFNLNWQIHKDIWFRSYSNSFFEHILENIFNKQTYIIESYESFVIEAGFSLEYKTKYRSKNELSDYVLVCLCLKKIKDKYEFYLVINIATIHNCQITDADKITLKNVNIQILNDNEYKNIVFLETAPHCYIQYLFDSDQIQNVSSVILSYEIINDSQEIHRHETYSLSDIEKLYKMHRLI